MEIVKSLAEIKANMDMLDYYLSKKATNEYSMASKLIKRGKCFIVVGTNNGYRFYPSRFVGYAENTLEKHDRNREKDGRITNSAIQKLLNRELSPNGRLEIEFQRFCEKLGVIPEQKDRKYWEL